MKNFTIRALAIVLTAIYSGVSGAAGHDHSHHAAGHIHISNEPIGVMGTHAHAQGDWMLSYRGMRMEMEGNRDHSSRMTVAEVFAEGFMIAPERMRMDMQMLGLMYGVSDKLTAMLMIPYLDIEMDHVTKTGVKFTTKTQGVGDVKLSGLYKLRKWGHHELNLNAGISFPTGSIDEKDDTPAGANQHLPYPMQLGSGTYDLMPGLTYSGHKGDFAWGTQGVAVVRLGDNDNDYTLGDRFHFSSWLSKDWSGAVSTSVRFNAQWWNDVDGTDRKLPVLAPKMVPTADPELRAGRRSDVLVGVSFAPTYGFLKGHRIAVEYGRPVYQSLDGPQLETDWTAHVGWQWAI